MKVRISDVHNSHGSVFTVSLTAENPEDVETIEFLGRQRRRLVFDGGRSLFYNYSFEVGDDSCHIGFSEEGVRETSVDHLWNPSRDDQKFSVLVVHGIGDQHHEVRHYNCHWCKGDVWGVQRRAIEVYVANGNSYQKKLVQVHDRCQEVRDWQMANIPFPKTVSVV